MTTHTANHAYEVAYQGNLKTSQELVTHFPDMVAMGASSRQDELRHRHNEKKLIADCKDDRKEARKLLAESMKNTPDYELYRTLSQIVDLALKNGACLLFTFQQEGPQVEYKNVGFYNKNPAPRRTGSSRGRQRADV